MIEPTEQETTRRSVETENVKSVLSSMRTLVMNALEGERPDFRKAKRLCDVALMLHPAIGTRVADFQGEAEFECEIDEAAQGPHVGQMRMWRMRIPAAPAPPIGDELARRLYGIVDQYFARDMATKSASEREFEAKELETLLRLVPLVTGDRYEAVQSRIDVIVQHLGLAKEEIDGLVHPDVLGGHPPDGAGRQDARAADADDDRGDGGAASRALEADPAP